MPIKKLKSWNDLPAVSEAPLPTDLERSLDDHPLTEMLRARFKAGASLRLQLDPRADSGGWAIQGRFLTKILHHVLPKARISSVRGTDYPIAITLTDSTIVTDPSSFQFDLSDLKILNRGPSLPDKAELRTKLGLPIEAHVVSVYDAIKKSVDGRAVVAKIFTDPTVDIVLLSSQTNGARHETFGWHDTIPLIGSDEWTQMKPSQRPRRAIIFNETRQRLPYVHAAADEVVVLGAANIFEPIFAGRPTFFDRFGERGAGRAGWGRLVDVAQRSGAAHAFEDVDSFTRLFTERASSRPTQGRLNAADEATAITRILNALNETLTKP